jgi:hypothetical protein
MTSALVDESGETYLGARVSSLRQRVSPQIRSKLQNRRWRSADNVENRRRPVAFVLGFSDLDTTEP